MEHGVLIRQAGVEAPYQIGKIERHGDIFKSMLKNIVKENAVTGFSGIENSSASVRSTKNSMMRAGGYSPSQWVLGVNPCSTDADQAADLGLFQSRIDLATTFAQSAALRLPARRAFVREDCGRKFVRALLRKSPPAVGKYQVGDVVSYYKQDHGWSTASRIIGLHMVASPSVLPLAASGRLRPRKLSPESSF
jgi:hypothetical protein